MCRRIETPKDFRFLSARIHAHTGEVLSSTTLKRLWGYLSEEVEPHGSTLSTLARFSGYASWNDFCDKLSRLADGVNEQPLFGAAVAAYHLRAGQRLTITWLPNSRLSLVCRGNGRFEVCESRHSLLSAGDTLEIGLIFRAQPLFVTHIRSTRFAHSSLIIAPKTGVNVVEG